MQYILLTTQLLDLVNLPIIGQRLTSVELQRISASRSTGSAISVFWALAILGLVLVLISSIALIQWYRTRNQRPQPLRLFRQIASSIGLNISDQLLLWQIARKCQLPSPLTLLLSDNTLQYYAESYAHSLPGDRNKRILARIRTIRQYLFAEHLANDHANHDR